MAAKSQVFGLSIDGGWNTEAGSSAGTRMSSQTTISVAWLLTADNIVYSLDGWPRKMPGASRVNTLTTGSTSHIMGVFDYWRSTASGDPVQKRVIHSGTDIYKDDADGVWDSLSLTLEADKMPWYEVMNDKLVIASTSIVDVPQSYDQSTIANLSAGAPNFAFHAYHKTRMWAAGVDTNKSRLYYTVASNEADWAGSGSGSIDISPDDGDVITGLISHKNQLIIFKGPNKGSIWVITGSSPTGDDAFALEPFTRGVGCTSQQSIIRLRDDLLWWDDLGIHSLVATAAYGNYNEAFVSRDIASFFTKQLNHSRFRYVWGANFAAQGYALWCVTASGYTTNNRILMLDYRFNPVRFSLWNAGVVASIGMVRDTSMETVPWFGTYGGYVLRGNRADRNWETGSYTAKATFPYLGFGDPFFDKQVTAGRIGYRARGGESFTFGYKRDSQTQQTETITQPAGAVLSSTANPFILSGLPNLLTHSTLSGGRNRNVFVDMAGQFKEIQIELSQGTANGDLEPHSMALQVENAGIGMTAPLG